MNKADHRKDSDPWYDLPGPVSWWSKNYNYEKHGWVPEEDIVSADEAWKLMMSGKRVSKVPKLMKEYLPDNKHLLMKPKSVCDNMYLE